MRWLSRDPIGYEGGYNLYEYVESNPVKFVDPDGEQSQALAPIAGGALNPGVLAILTLAQTARLYCLWYPDDCKAIYDGFCDKYELNPNIYSTSDDSLNTEQKNKEEENRKEHTKNKRPSTKNKHQKGRARSDRDKRGGEKGDARRPY